MLFGPNLCQCLAQRLFRQAFGPFLVQTTNTLATFPATKPRLRLHCKAVSSDICNQRLSEVTAFDSRVILFVAIRASSCSANQKLISQAAPVVSVLFRSGFKIAGHKVQKPLSSSAYMASSDASKPALPRPQLVLQLGSTTWRQYQKF